MKQSWRLILGTVLVCAGALANASIAQATGVPISGFYPLAGISLTGKYADEENLSPPFFYAQYETTYSGTPLGVGSTPHFELALIDTGAAATLITSTADAAFNIQGAGYRGLHTFPITGATGEMDVVTNDAMAIYASGLGVSNRVSTGPLTLETSLMAGQSSTSLGTMPPESQLPNILGIPFTSQYATYIKNSEPQLFQVAGRTVRTPQIEFKPLGSGGQGVISRFVTINFQDPSPFLSPPQYVYDYNKIFETNPTPLTDDPLYPSLRLNGVLQPAAALFVDVDLYNDVPVGSPPQSLIDKPFLLDTGADVSVVSIENAARLGFDVVNDTPDFTVAALGSGGLLEGIPGFYVDHLNIVAAGGNITLNHVPFLVLDFPNPAQLGAVNEGLIGMNVLAGRDVVIDPKPAACSGCVPRLYVSNPVTSNHNWANATASGAWDTTTNWNGAGTPNILWISNARNISGSAQEALVNSNSTVWELNVSGTGPATMTVRVAAGTTLATYSGANIESSGVVRLDGGTLDAQYVDIRGGKLTGVGTVTTGSGPIEGQVENHGGIVAPGNGVGTLSIVGRFANAIDGTFAVDLGGTTAGTQYDQLVVDGVVALEGTLSVSLFNLGGGTFVPSVGNSFTLITASGELGGTFDNLQLPGGYTWNVAYNTNNVVLSVTGVGTPGDFNHDGKVDGADYVIWRKTGGTSQQYQDWRSHFGVGTGAGSGAYNSVNGGAVPEPTTVAMLSLAACGWALPPQTRYSARSVRSVDSL